MQKVLVMPRKWSSGMDGFVPWDQASSMFEGSKGDVKWLPRPRAEQSRDWIQPIPCAIFRDPHGRYCVLRYPKGSGSFSLIVGGHVDSGCNGEELAIIFSDTLKREVQEEIGLVIGHHPTPIGVTVDSSSVSASRHVGVVYEIEVAEQKLQPRASEEFSIRSQRSGSFFDIQALAGFRAAFDPWSFLIFSQYLAPKSDIDVGRQAEFSLTEDSPEYLKGQIAALEQISDRLIKVILAQADPHANPDVDPSIVVNLHTLDIGAHVGKTVREIIDSNPTLSGTPFCDGYHDAVAGFERKAAS